MMPFQKKNLIALGVALLVISLTSACSQKRRGWAPGIQAASASSNSLGYDNSNGNGNFGGFGNSGGRFLRPAYIFNEITSGARIFAEGDLAFMTGKGQGFGTFSFTSGNFMSGLAALESGARLGANLFSSTNVRSVRSMAKVGNYLFISSDSGLFQFDVSNPSNPYLYLKLPDSGVSGLNTSAFQWDSMVYDPVTAQLLGLKGNQLFSMRIGDRAPRVSQLPFNIACGRGAAQFRGKIYVAGCNQLWVLTPNSYSGGFETNYFSKGINPQLIAAGGKYLYAYHSPVMGTGSVNARSGIYVFDQNETQVNFINLPRLKSFAVSGDDRYIIANEYDEDVAIYRIP